LINKYLGHGKSEIFSDNSIVFLFSKSLGGNLSFRKIELFLLPSFYMREWGQEGKWMICKALSRYNFLNKCMEYTN
jgi:hypothetical protein